MPDSRYRQSRILVRPLCRLPHQDRQHFRHNVAHLRRHFEQFNTDVSELCQWFMGLRKDQPAIRATSSFGPLGDFLLTPQLEDADPCESSPHHWRLQVFDVVAGIRPSLAELAGLPLPQDLLQAIHAHASRPRTPTASALFERLARLQPAHRLVLLKAAAEWIVARYKRALENWVRRNEEWEKEKDQWLSMHPQLTQQARQKFTNAFKSLNDPQKGRLSDVRRKNPRICPYERLKHNTDNCIYGGQKGHGPFCWKFDEFVKTRQEHVPRFNRGRFFQEAENYLKLRGQRQLKRHQALLFPKSRQDHQRCQQRFMDNWNAYLKAMGLREDSLVQAKRLPHCLKIGETFEKSKCQFSPHTDLCRQYHRALCNPQNGFDDETLALEPLYRHWRKEYLAGPAKPSFRYPSSRDLPIPKIFGAGFHQIDFDRSIVRLRLDDMPNGQWLDFGFTPWPKKYKPSRDQVKDMVTSVHVNFIGARPRVGFRFDVLHRQSRFACSQDEIDDLRSRQFPRRAHDHDFLNAARDLLLDSFEGGPAAAQQNLRLLAVDLGETGAHAVVFSGKEKIENDIPLRIIKVDRLYTGLEESREGRQPSPDLFPVKEGDSRGLRKEHLARHQQAMAEGAAKIAQYRQAAPSANQALASHDLRALKLHMGWMIRDWARHNASRIIDAASQHNCDLIVFESLRGFRLPGYEQMDPEKKRRLAMFAFGRIRKKVTEKAVERGMRVVTVPYFKSSQVCAKCGTPQKNIGPWRKNKRNRIFKCEDCEFQLNSDANAARVLGRVFWGDIVLPAPTEP